MAQSDGDMTLTHAELTPSTIEGCFAFQVSKHQMCY